MIAARNLHPRLMLVPGSLSCSSESPPLSAGEVSCISPTPVCPLGSVRNAFGLPPLSAQMIAKTQARGTPRAFFDASVCQRLTTLVAKSFPSLGESASVRPSRITSPCEVIE